MFRRRRKSGANLMITDLVINDSEVEKPSKNKSGKARRRSNSIQIGETKPMSIPTSNSHEPLRVTLAKRELECRMSSSPSELSTPMSQLLSNSLGQAEMSRALSRKIGPGEFLKMYRNRRCSLDSGSSPALVNLLNKKV